MTAVPFGEEFPEGPAVRGFLHRPDQPSGDALVLTHGAGSNCETKILVAVAEGFAAAGFAVLRCDLHFRQAGLRPFPATSALDREGLRRAVDALRRTVSPRRIFLGGHSYGGRQGTMLAADDPGLVDALLLLSYPLHPPKQPANLRTAHFPKLQTPALFVQGARDDFGSIDEMRAALALIPARTSLLPVGGARHALRPAAAADIVAAFNDFLAAVT